MKAILIGGPRHGDYERFEEDDCPDVLQVGIAKSPQEQKEWQNLETVGIQPPIGAVVLYYFRVGHLENPLVYFFAGMEGDWDKLQKESEE